MSLYAAGFSAGERRAFQERKDGTYGGHDYPAQTEWQRGFQDGYTPRSPTWARQPVRIEVWGITEPA